LDDLEIPKAFLGYLYSKNFIDEDPTLDTIEDWVTASGIDKALFWRQYELMVRAKLVKLMQDEGTVRLTPKGTLHAEKLGLAAFGDIARNRLMRKQMMHAMAYFITRQGPNVDIVDLIREADITDDRFYGNLQLLIELGYARWRVQNKQISVNPKVCAKTQPLVDAA